MDFNRRNFIQKVSGAAGTFALGSLLSPALANSIERAFEKVAHLSPEDCAVDEEFWYQIKMAYTVSPTVLNLNNGGCQPTTPKWSRMLSNATTN